MSVAALITDDRFEKALVELLGREHMKLHLSTTIAGLLEESMNVIPRVFIIQDSSERALRILDLVRDLRQLFGAVVTVAIVGEDIPGARVAALIGAGADNIFSYPFDAGLLEDFLFKSARKEICRPFKYRHVPSGETPISIKLLVYISEINAGGVLFESRDFISAGTILALDLSFLLELPNTQVRVRIVSSEKTSSGAFGSRSEFVDLDEDMRKRIAFILKG